MIHLLAIDIHGSFLLLNRNILVVTVISSNYLVAVVSADDTFMETKRRKMENVVFEGVFN